MNKIPIVSCIVTHNSVIEKMNTYLDTEEGNKKVKEKFIERCKEYIIDFENTFNKEDIESILEDGYVETGYCESAICIWYSFLDGQEGIKKGDE